MTRNRKIVLASVAALLVLLGGAATLGWLACRDDPPPDDGDLWVRGESIPDAENGFLLLDEAQRSAIQPPDSTAVYRAIEGDAWNATAVESFLAANAKALALRDQGLARGGFRWPDSGSTHAASAGYLVLAKCSSLRSLELFRRGREKEAIDEALKNIDLGCRLENGQGLFIHYLAGIATKDFGLHRLQQLVADAKLDSAELRECGQRLSPCGIASQGAANAARAEYRIRCSSIDGVLAQLTHRGSRPPSIRAGLVWSYELKVNRTKVVLAAVCRAQVANAGLTYSESAPARDRLAKEASTSEADMQSALSWLRPNGLGRSVLAVALGVGDPGAEVKCRENVHVSAIRLQIAILGFQKAKGKLPDRLDDLVPEFIEAVPPDDFDGKPMRWSKEKRIVYSVGPDLADDGGNETEVARQGHKDLVYHLDPKDAKKPAAAEAR